MSVRWLRNLAALSTNPIRDVVGVVVQHIAVVAVDRSIPADSTVRLIIIVGVGVANLAIEDGCRCRCL